MSPEKGLGVLVAAYGRYRARSARPWPLLAFGAGPLEGTLRGVEGVDLRGFVQPADLPDALEQTGCVVVPSLVEPWAVVVEEAAAAGVPVICSEACGASIHLVQDGLSGYIVATGDVDDLSSALLRYTALPDERRSEMSREAHRLSWQFTPERWARTVVERSRELLASR